MVANKAERLKKRESPIVKKTNPKVQVKSSVRLLIKLEALSKPKAINPRAIFDINPELSKSESEIASNTDGQ